MLETGMGGRLDATNAITPAASLITSIDFDHTAWLGDTLAAIAGEEGGHHQARRAGRQHGPAGSRRRRR